MATHPYGHGVGSTLEHDVQRWPPTHMVMGWAPVITLEHDVQRWPPTHMVMGWAPVITLKHTHEVQKILMGPVHITNEFTTSGCRKPAVACSQERSKPKILHLLFAIYCFAQKEPPCGDVSCLASGKQGYHSIRLKEVENCSFIFLG